MPNTTYVYICDCELTDSQIIGTIWNGDPGSPLTVVSRITCSCKEQRITFDRALSVDEKTAFDAYMALKNYTFDRIDTGALPTPSESYRGKKYLVLGGVGVDDVIYICLKTSADTYVWRAIIDGDGEMFTTKVNFI